MPRKKTFDEKISRLEEIVAEMSSDQLSLEKSVKLYEEGMTLLKKCEDDLKSAEGKIALLTNNQSGYSELEEITEKDLEE
ncbi:exodeoxyribonuclease VII small subunit [Pseudoramibacter porci]|uniref:Exodeoxyribonuclease 7 small subunit n=1 Tax=Pseudoramibacter porci TaxID=2606631 RepID=A0A7X2TAV5_9FIRM|nr:exodeoxyribonuclease VII small subunit [Pseudoramibacter porci]MSS19886.1 exodeoxyribonuclease VII small subunit [Pseudoramibacter porci]